jgi:hypothetical protein
MAAPSIPNTEPCQIVAGDSVAWTKTIATYAGTLNYSLQFFGSTDLPITFAASGAGPNYSVALDDSVTATWKPGRYIWTAWIADATDRHVVENGEILVFANPALAFGATHATRTLAIIEAAIEGRLPRGLETYAIDGQSIAKIPIEGLVRLRSLYAGYVANEYAQDRINRGGSNPRNVFARFVSPRSNRWPFSR